MSKKINNKKIMSKTPTLFKYVSPGSLSKILENCSFKFSRPSEFNDPFDCNFASYNGAVNIDDLFLKYLPRDSKIKKKDLQLFLRQQNYFKEFNEIILSSLEEVRENWDVYLEEYRVLCLTPLRDNILMWSHYARDHSGTVIGLNVNEEPFSKAIRPVDYPKKNDSIDNLISSGLDSLFKFASSHSDGIMAGLDAIEQQMDDNDIIHRVVAYGINKLHPCFYIKKKEWSYEKEYRLVGRNFDSQWIKFNPSSIKEIIFGIKTSEDEKDEIWKKIKELDIYPSIFQARKVNAELTFSQINY